MKINAEQLAMFNVYSTNSYVSEMVQHCKNVFPLVYSSMNEKYLRANISKLIEKASLSNVTQRGPLQLYFDMAVTLGSEFETDPMYSDLSFKPDQFPSSNQLDISLFIHEKFSAYIENVIGEDGKYAKDFLNRLNSKVFTSIQENGFSDVMYNLLSEVYPQKCEYLGRERVNSIIALGVVNSKKYNLSPKVQTLYIMLMFVVGHEFEKDLFHLNNGLFNSGNEDDSFYMSKSKDLIINFINALIF